MGMKLLHISGKMRKNYIRILTGDKVKSWNDTLRLIERTYYLPRSIVV